jgi:hypothetical protein
MSWTAIAMVLTAACAFGHHSLHATYFLDQQVTLQGKVTNVLYRNPHSFLQVEAPDAAGQRQQWAIEWFPAGVLAARGIQRDTLKPGDEVTITMSPSRVAADHRGLLRIIRRHSDGFEWGTKPGEVVLEWGMAHK